MPPLFATILIGVFVIVALLQIFTLKKASKEANSVKTNNNGKS